MSGECFVRDIFQQERGFETYSSALLGIERDAVMWAEILRPLLESEVARLGPTLGEVLGVAETIKTKFAEFWARIQVSGEKPELLAATSDMTKALFLELTALTPDGFVWLDRSEGVTLRLAIERGGATAGEACLTAMLAPPRAGASTNQRSADLGASLGTFWILMRDHWQPELESRLSDHNHQVGASVNLLKNSIAKAERASKEIAQTGAVWQQKVLDRFEEADQRTQKRTEDLDAKISESEHRLDSILEKHGHDAAIEGPSKRWDRRADELKIQENALLTGIYLVTIAGMAYLGILLDQWITESPWMPMSVGSFKGIAIFLAILAGWGFLLRTLARLTFSTIHLRRDAEERLALSQYYVSLLETDKEIGDQARQVILSALFTRSQSGLLQTESDPSVGFDTLLSRFRS